MGSGRAGTMGRGRSILALWRGRGLTAGLLMLAGLSAGCHKEHVVLTVSAAASLTEALGEAETAYRGKHPEVEIRNNFGGSGALARQIEAGAPVDVFFSAAAGPMDELEQRGLLVAGSRRTVLGNRLALVVRPVWAAARLLQVRPAMAVTLVLAVTPVTAAPAARAATAAPEARSSAAAGTAA